MSAQWMVYAVAVGAVVTLAALAAEQGTRLARRPGRWMWALAMVLTVALPLLALGDGGRQPGPRALAPTMVLSGFPATPALAPREWLPGAGPAGIDQAVRIGWLLSSALALAALAGARQALQRRRRHWQPGSIAGAAVLVSSDAGPAVAGVRHPRIVVPYWLADLEPGRQALIVAHEQSHIDAGDQRLLAAMMALLVLMPWNVPLWFQLRRLRLAIEVDCDARVLAQGHRVADYGAALIAVGCHAPQATMPRMAALTPAVGTSASFIERRLRVMTRRPARWHRFVSAMLLLLALDIGVVAARIGPPQGAGAPFSVTGR